MRFVKVPIPIYRRRIPPVVRDFYAGLRVLCYLKTGDYIGFTTSIHEIGQELGVSRSTVFRHLTRCQREQLVAYHTHREANPDTGEEYVLCTIEFQDSAGALNSPAPHTASLKSETGPRQDPPAPATTGAPIPQTHPDPASTETLPASDTPSPGVDGSLKNETSVKSETIFKDLDDDRTSGSGDHHHQISKDGLKSETGGLNFETGTPDEREAIGDALWTFADWTGLPLDQVVAAELAASCALGQVQAGILDAAAMAQTLDNPIAYLVNRLRQGQWAGEPPLNAETWARYEEYDYRDLLTHFRGGRYGHLIEH